MIPTPMRRQETWTASSRRKALVFRKRRGEQASAGPRVVKRNDGRLDVRNGDRGVVDRVDIGAGTLHVRFGERTAALDARFLAQPTRAGRPALEYGYAITAYAAQA